MLFNSTEFLFLFLTVVLLVFILLSRTGNTRAQAVCLVLDSIVFCGSWNPLLVSLIVVSVVTNFFFGKRLASNVTSSRALLVIGVVFNLGLLGYFKYAGFFVDIWWRLGHKESWREFHRHLAEVNASVAAEVGRPPFSLLGFNHLAGVVDEPIRSAGQSKRSIFTDGVHFRPQLGDDIMEAAWGGGAGAAVTLEAPAVDGYVDAVESLIKNFNAVNAEEASRMRRSVSPALE